MHDKVVLRKRQPPNKRQQTENQRAWVENFKQLACWSKSPDPRAFEEAEKLAAGTNWYYRDVVETALSGKLFQREGETRVTTPTAFLTRATDFQINGGAFSAIPMTAAVWDNNFFWSATVNPTRITCRTPGLYLVFGTTRLVTNNAGAMTAELCINGGASLAGSRVTKANDFTMANVTLVYYFHANDYVELKCFNSANNAQFRSPGLRIVAITPEGIIR